MRKPSPYQVGDRLTFAPTMARALVVKVVAVLDVWVVRGGAAYQSLEVELETPTDALHPAGSVGEAVVGLIRPWISFAKLEGKA